MAKQAEVYHRVFSLRRALSESAIGRISFPSRSQLLATALLVLVLSPIFAPLRSAWAPSSNALSMSVVENVNLLENGYADMNIVYNVSNSHLADTYRQMLAAPSDAAVGEEMPIPESKVESGLTMSVRDEFYKSVKEEQQVSLGFRTWIDDSSMIPRGEHGECLVSLDATLAPQIVNSTILGSDALVEVAVGPNGDNATDKAIETAFNKVILAQSLLKSLNETGPYDCDWTTRITLPPGAGLLNGYDLAGTSWLVNFGGGTSFSASLTLDGQPSTIIVDERTTVTTQDISTSPDDLCQALLHYRVFEIKYLLPNTTWTGQANNGTNEPGDWSSSIDWNWTSTYWINFTQGFTAQDPFSVRGMRAFVNLTVEVTPEFEFSAFIGWETEHWYGGFKWFEAWVKARAACDVYVHAYVNASFRTIWTDDENLINHDISLWIGFIPVVLNLRLDLVPTLDFTATGYILFQVEAKVSMGFKAGIHYDDQGWHTIWEPELKASHTTPIINAEFSITIIPKLDLKVQLLLYDVVGPYLDLEVCGYGTANFGMDNNVGLYLLKWDFSICLVVLFGIGFGDNWLTDLFGLTRMGWQWMLYNETLGSWHGSFGTTPSNITITKVTPSPPGVVNPGEKATVYGEVASSTEGDKTGQVTVEYSKDNQTWAPAGTTESDPKGHFTLDWFPDVDTVAGIEQYSLRATWEGNDKFSSAMEPPGNYTQLLVQILGGSNPFDDWCYISDTALCKNIYYANDADGQDRQIRQLENQNWGTSIWPFAYEAWGWTDPLPDSNPTNTFFADDGSIYSWFRMQHVLENSIVGTNEPLPGGLTWVCWDLYDPSGKHVAHVDDISNTYTQIPSVYMGFIDYASERPPNWQPTIYEPSVGNTVACLPWAITYQTDCYSGGPGGALCHLNYYCWPWWTCAAKFNIDPEWADKGPCTIVVHTSLFPLQYPDNTLNPLPDQSSLHQLVFNQTFTVVKHPTTTHIYCFPQGGGSRRPFPNNMACMKDGSLLLFDVETTSDSGKSVTDKGNVTVQYSTDWGQTWVNYAIGLPWACNYIESPFQGQGNFYLRVLWSPGNVVFEPLEYESSTSETIFVSVYSVPVQLAVSTSADSVIVGGTVNIMGYLWFEDMYFDDPLPPQYSSRFEPLELENVTIEYQYSDGNTLTGWKYLAKVMTGTEYGEYSYAWTPTTVGTYRIRAHFYGDPPYDEWWQETGELFYVNPAKPTAVEVVAGDKSQIERGTGSVQFQVRVKDVGTGYYLGGGNCSMGAVEFFVLDPASGYGELIGIDNDTDGDGLYTCTWNPNDWTYTATEQWAAYFIGTPGEYADSMANSSIEIWRSHVDISVANHIIVLRPRESTSFDVNLTLSRGVPDTFNLSIEGLDSSWYKFSNDSVYLHMILSLPPLPVIPDIETVSLEISVPFAPCLLDNPFKIVAQSTIDPLSSDYLDCILYVKFSPEVPTTPYGGIAVYVNPKTFIHAMNTPPPPNPWEYLQYPSPTGYCFEFNVTVFNYESFDDVILVRIRTDGLPFEARAIMRWFNWTETAVFVPTYKQHGSITLGLSADILFKDVPSTDLNWTRLFRVTANSTVWDKGYATDTGTFTNTDTQYDQEAQATIAPIERRIYSLGDMATFRVNLKSTATEDQNARLTIQGDRSLAFSWEVREALPFAARTLNGYRLGVTFSGTSSGNYPFTVKNEAWPVSLSYEQARQNGSIETNSYTDYVQVTPEAVAPGASFTYSPSMPMAGDTVTLNASASTARGKTIVSFTWDFGDSNITATSGPIITHVYSIGGTYNVNLTVTDTDGLTDSTEQTLTVFVQVTFSQAGVGSDFSGTILAVDGTPYGTTDLPKTFTWVGSTSHAFVYQSPLVVGSGAKQYDWTSTSGMSELQSGLIGLTTSGSITGNYLTHVHDVAVTNITVGNQWVFQGRQVNVNVTIKNKGDFTENVTITLYYNITLDQVLGTQQISLLPGQNNTLLFTRNTMGLTYNHNYSLAAVAAIPSDVNLTDNTLTAEPVTVRILGDINGDGRVSGDDLITVAWSFGAYGPNCFYPGSPPSPRWNPDADVDNDLKIDGSDLIVMARNFGK